MARKEGLINWEKELAEQAQASTAMEASTAAGQFFSLKVGVLCWNGAPIEGNRMGVVIVGWLLENVYYSGRYDDSAPQAPKCFAFGLEEANMRPHGDVVKAGQAEHAACQGCPQNEWASAEQGRGKACKNTRRLALVAAGNFGKEGFELIRDPVHFEQSAVGYLRLPVTSVKAYSAFVKQVGGVLKRPPYGVVTQVAVVPDQRTQFRVTFTAIQPLPDSLLPAVARRHKEVAAAIDFPYPVGEQAAGNGEGPKGRGKPPVNGGHEKRREQAPIRASNQPTPMVGFGTVPTKRKY